MSAAGPRTQALLARASALETALARAKRQVPARTARRVRAILEGVRQRLELGVDHTIVALAGGTGSGKSSVFNALSGFEFADVGVRRPTTAEVTACVWAHDADLLLSWLGVARDRRIERESALDGDEQADLRGLVLLDLPDHDSIEPAHRAVVDRVLPQVDLLVWVVDPQKYADDALHNRYLKELAGHEGSMIVLLNQVDTVPREAQAALLADVARLLREDGLTGVGVYAASARTGEGLPALRAALARAVAARGLAEVRAEAELDDAARLLGATVADAEPDLAGPADRAVDGLLAAAGVAESAAGLERAVRSGDRTPVRLGPTAPERVEAVRDAWLDAVAGPLPRLWARTVREKVADAPELAAAADAALERVVPPSGRARGAQVLKVLAALVGLGALAMAGFTAAALGAAPDGLRDALAWDAGTALLAGVTGGAVLLALLLLVAARAARARTARRRAAELTARGRRALAEVADQHLVAPAVAVLEDHRALREAAALATDPVVRRASRPASALEPDALEADADAGDAEGDDGAEGEG
jgi:predicted GTPase